MEMGNDIKLNLQNTLPYTNLPNSATLQSQAQYPLYLNNVNPMTNMNTIPPVNKAPNLNTVPYLNTMNTNINNSNNMTNNVVSPLQKFLQTHQKYASLTSLYPSTPHQPSYQPPPPTYIPIHINLPSNVNLSQPQYSTGQMVNPNVKQANPVQYNYVNIPTQINMNPILMQQPNIIQTSNQSNSNGGFIGYYAMPSYYPRTKYQDQGVSIVNSNTNSIPGFSTGKMTSFDGKRRTIGKKDKIQNNDKDEKSSAEDKNKSKNEENQTEKSNKDDSDDIKVEYIS